MLSFLWAVLITCWIIGCSAALYIIEGYAYGADPSKEKL